jgi:hypothetical protein
MAQWKAPRQLVLEDHVTYHESCTMREATPNFAHKARCALLENGEVTSSRLGDFCVPFVVGACTIFIKTETLLLISKSMAATRKKLLLKVLILGDARYVQLEGSIQLLLLILVTRVVWGRHLSCSVTSKEPTKKATRQLLVWRAVHECIVTTALTPTPKQAPISCPRTW